MENRSTVSDRVAQNIREFRKRRGWKPADLAARCAELGADFVTDNVIENIEHGRRRDGARRRHITVDELVALARALAVTPADLCPDLAEGLPPGQVDPIEAMRAYLLGALRILDSFQKSAVCPPTRSKQ